MTVCYVGKNVNHSYNEYHGYYEDNDYLEMKFEMRLTHPENFGKPSEGKLGIERPDYYRLFGILEVEDRRNKGNKFVEEICLFDNGDCEELYDEVTACDYYAFLLPMRSQYMLARVLYEAWYKSIVGQPDGLEVNLKDLSETIGNAERWILKHYPEGERFSSCRLYQGTQEQRYRWSSGDFCVERHGNFLDLSIEGLSKIKAEDRVVYSEEEAEKRAIYIYDEWYSDDICWVDWSRVVEGLSDENSPLGYGGGFLIVFDRVVDQLANVVNLYMWVEYIEPERVYFSVETSYDKIFLDEDQWYISH